MDGSGEIALRAVLVVLGGSSVASLLAWLFGLGRFSWWFVAVSVPGTLAIVLVGLWLTGSGRLPRLREDLVAGAVGGLAGTLAYDVVRVPFVLAGLRVLAPIDSYGVLAVGASGSSPFTGFVGWSYHFANGVGFGIAFAMVAARRRWWWAVPWALLLETAAVVSPFATTYALRGKWVAIAIAYAAHVPYGVLLGLACERAPAVARELRAAGRVATPALFAGVAVALALWLRPWAVPGDLDVARQVADGPSAVVVDGRLVPEWVRVAPGECIAIRNDDAHTYTISAEAVRERLPAGEVTLVCPKEAGVHRVRTTLEAYSGGFFVVDHALD